MIHTISDTYTTSQASFSPPIAMLDVAPPLIYRLPVIELIEVAPPTPPRPIHSTSYFSSSAGSDDSESEMDVEQESYCSSDINTDGIHLPQPIHDNASFQRCIKRILQWRERSYLSGMSLPSCPYSYPHSLYR